MRRSFSSSIGDFSHVFQRRAGERESVGSAEISPTLCQRQFFGRISTVKAGNDTQMGGRPGVTRDQGSPVPGRVTTASDDWGRHSAGAGDVVTSKAR